MLEEGSPTAHVTIVARALDIPMVGRVEGLLRRVEPGDPLVLDGDNGQVFVRPADDIRRPFAREHAGPRPARADVRGHRATCRR